jgi:branched-chain amino acid transport system substrate-binding protein
MKRILVLLAILCLMAAVPLACDKGGEDDNIRIGVILPFSGDLASYGKTALEGIILRADEINQAGGIDGRTIELIVEDNKADKNATRQAFKKLADVSNVVAVVGPLTSTSAFGAKIDAHAYKIPMVSPTATNDDVTANTPWVFRAIFSDSFQGQVLAAYAAEDLGITRAALMVDKGSDYSKGLSTRFMEEFERLGGRIVAEESYQQKDTEFGSQLTRIKEADAELIFVPGYPPAVGLIIKQAKVVGFEGRLCGADGWDSEDVLQKAGDNIEGCFITGTFSPEDDRPVVQEFVRKIRQRTGRMPGGFEAQGYDSVSMIAEAIRTTGATPEQIRQGLVAIDDLPAVTGTMDVLDSGDVRKPAVILRITRAPEGDRYVKKYVKTVGQR